MIHTNFLLRHQFNWGQEWASLAGSSSAAQVGRSSQPGVLSAQGWRSLTSALPCLESGSFDRYCLPKKCLVLLNSILWCRDRPPHNFDSLQTATLTLYRVTTIKYVEILRAAMDVTFYDVSPRWNLCLLCGICVYECSIQTNNFDLTFLRDRVIDLQAGFFFGQQPLLCHLPHPRQLFCHQRFYCVRTQNNRTC